VKKVDGSLYEVLWAGWCLDMTHPGARAFLSDAVRRITGEWGYRYLKPDAMWCGLAAKCTYPGTAYVEDKFGDAVFHDPYLTGIEAYRAGIRTLREAAAPPLMWRPAMSPKTSAPWAAPWSRRRHAHRARYRRRLGGDPAELPPRHPPLLPPQPRLDNDPDCLMVRPPLTLTQARTFASWVALSGCLNLVSEWLPGLPADRLECVKRSMPNTGLAARPLDLFEHMPAQAWRLTNGRRHVAGLFNWDASKPVKVAVKLADLGLGTDGGRFLAWTTGAAAWFRSRTAPSGRNCHRADAASWPSPNCSTGRNSWARRATSRSVLSMSARNGGISPPSPAPANSWAGMRPNCASPHPQPRAFGRP